MGSTFKNVTLLFAFVLLCPSVLFATESLRGGGASSEVSVSLIPFSIQTVSFKSPSFTNKISKYGVAGRFAYFCNLGNIFSIGAALAPGFHVFSKDYFNFTNIQLDGRIRLALIRTRDRFFTFLISGGAGTDLALRSDGDGGFYFLATCGAEMDFKLSDNSSITAGCDVGFSFHPESKYCQFAPFVGYKKVL